MGMGLDHCINYAFHVWCLICYMIVCCVNNIHGKVYIGKKKRNTRVRKHNLRGSGKERTGKFGM